MTVRDTERATLEAPHGGPGDAAEPRQAQATLLFTDIVGYSGMTEALGDQRSHRILRDHHRVVRDEVAAYLGREVKSLGDGFMTVFPSASLALACAKAIQRRLASDARLRGVCVRIGIHTGDVIVDGDDLYGLNVVVAERVCRAASAGQTLVSGRVRELAAPAGMFSFDGGRTVSLKGLSRRHTLYALSA